MRLIHYVWSVDKRNTMHYRSHLDYPEVKLVDGLTGRIPPGQCFYLGTLIEGPRNKGF
jgi:hypothetical protein